MSKKDTFDLAMEVEVWCLYHARIWKKTATYPYFFLVLNPHTKTFCVKRWGYLKRPFGIEPILWQRVEVTDFIEVARNINKIILNWEEHWGKISYMQNQNELPPFPYPNSIRAQNETNTLFAVNY